MVNVARPLRSSPSELDGATQSLTIFIDVEAYCARARTVARIVEEPHETAYGEYQYGVLDLEGHLWLFARHERDVIPDAWGATITTPLT